MEIETTCRICGVVFRYEKGVGRPKTVCPAEACARKGARDRFAGTTTLPSVTTTAFCVVCGEEFRYELRTNRRSKCDSEVCQRTRGCGLAEYEREPDAAITSRSPARTEDRRTWLDGLKTGPCLDCGGQFPPECMDFDHRAGEEKTGQVSSLWLSAKERVLAEIAKCDLICSNCHRIRTFRRARLLKFLDGTASHPDERKFSA